MILNSCELPGMLLKIPNVIENPVNPGRRVSRHAPARVGQIINEGILRSTRNPPRPRTEKQPVQFFASATIFPDFD